MLRNGLYHHFAVFLTSDLRSKFLRCIFFPFYGETPYLRLYPLYRGYLLRLFSSMVSITFSLISNESSVATSSGSGVLPNVRVKGASDPSCSLIMNFNRNPVRIRDLIVELISRRRVSVIDLRPNRQFFGTLPNRFVTNPNLARLHHGRSVLPTRATLNRNLTSRNFVIMRINHVSRTMSRDRDVRSHPLPHFTLRRPHAGTSGQRNRTVVRGSVLVRAAPPFVLRGSTDSKFRPSDVRRI